VGLDLTKAQTEELCSIGLTVVLESYFARLKELAEDDGEDWDDYSGRMDIIGQNGNDGDHY
jgi:hypothetical protein